MAQRVGCDPAEVEVVLPDASEETRRAWTCHPKGGDVDMGGTPLPWVFGRDSCIEVSHGPTTSFRSYSPCKEAD